MNDSKGRETRDASGDEPAEPNGNRTSEIFYNRTIWRLQWSIGVLSIVLVAVSALRFGTTVALGAAVGAVISWQNFRWLAHVVNALGERITSGQSQERGSVLVFRFVSRILLIALGAYVIFRYSLSGLYGFLAGLCVPVPAMLCEAAYELYAALRRGL